MASTKPTIVIVPGAYHLPEAYNLLTTGLRTHGYSVIVVASRAQLSPAGPFPEQAPSPDVDYLAIREVLIEECEHKGHDVLVVMHSAGGSPGTSAVEGLLKDDRKSKGASGGIVALVYMCSFALSEGMSLLDAYVKYQWETWTVPVGPNSDWLLVPDENIKIYLYSDISDKAIVSDLTSKLQLQAVSSFLFKTTYAAWKYLPSTYIMATQDHGVLADASETMIAQEGAKFEVVKIRAGHSPWITKTDEVVRVVRRAAGEAMT